MSDRFQMTWLERAMSSPITSHLIIGTIGVIFGVIAIPRIYMSMQPRAPYVAEEVRVATKTATLRATGRTRDNVSVSIPITYGVWEMQDATAHSVLLIVETVTEERELADLCRMAATGTGSGYTQLEAAIRMHATLTTRVLTPRILGPVEGCTQPEDH